MLEAARGSLRPAVLAKSCHQRAFTALPRCRLPTPTRLDVPRRPYSSTWPLQQRYTTALLPCRLGGVASQSLPRTVPRCRSVTTSSKSEPYSRWKVFARAVRYIRIPVLVASVYSLGYQQGIIEYARNPNELKEALLDSVLAGVGCSDRKDVSSIQNGESASVFSSTANREVQQVARVGGKIMQAAQQLAAQKQQEAAQVVKSKLPSDIPNDKLIEILDQDEDYQTWTTAVEQLNGNWTYLLIDSSLPNAFVTEILPRHIFITTSMLGMIANEDELALVLGHELSHMLLGHITQKNMLETMLRTVEVLLLSMDPTTGLLSLAFVGSLATLRTAFTAAHSREHEHEADQLGIQLTAMACFDTQKAAAVFRKLHQQNVGPPSGKRLLSFADTHPPSDDRYEKLILASTTENVDKYSDTTCASVGSRLRSIMNANSSGNNSNEK